MDEKRIAWAITGAGHFLEECIETILNHDRVDIFLSRAAEEESPPPMDTSLFNAMSAPLRWMPMPATADATPST